MNEQPEALRLADELENGECFDVGSCGVAYGWMHNDPTSESADELRRLHADNERLRKTLKDLLHIPKCDGTKETSAKRLDIKRRAKAELKEQPR